MQPDFTIYTRYVIYLVLNVLSQDSLTSNLPGRNLCFCPAYKIKKITAKDYAQYRFTSTNNSIHNDEAFTYKL